MDTVGLYVSAKQIKDISNFNVSTALSSRPSTMFATAANTICRILRYFNIYNTFLEDIPDFSILFGLFSSDMLF